MAEGAVSILWDELLNLPADRSGRELAGLLSSLPVALGGDDAVIDARRLVLAKRILKLAKAAGYFTGERPASGEFSLEVDKNRGRAFFRVKKENYLRLAGAAPGTGRARWNWFRGAWGGCGALYLPSNGYYMVMRIGDDAGYGEILRAAFRSAGIRPGVRRNKGKTEYMVRGLEGITACFVRMGLVKTSLALEDTATLRYVRGMANKAVNCDSANIEKSLRAARAQTALVEALEERNLWGLLPPDIAELARLRRDNPSASLGELGQILSKPVSKSTVEYRWRKLESLIGEEKNTVKGDGCDVPRQSGRQHL
jgi:hypothetical protein